jgi:hypothetical protein
MASQLQRNAGNLSTKPGIVLPKSEAPDRSEAPQLCGVHRPALSSLPCLSIGPSESGLFYGESPINYAPDLHHRLLFGCFVTQSEHLRVAHQHRPSSHVGLTALNDRIFDAAILHPR